MTNSVKPNKISSAQKASSLSAAKVKTLAPLGLFTIAKKLITNAGESRDPEASDESVDNVNASDTQSVGPGKLWDYIFNKKYDALPDGMLKTTIDYLLPPPGQKGLAAQACKVTYTANFIGFALETLSALNIVPLSKKAIDGIEKVNTWITRLSFYPYGIDGAINNLRKKSIFGALGFALDPICATLGNLKDIYFLRGFSTGLESLPVAVEELAGSVFNSFEEGFTKVAGATWQQVKDTIRNPAILFSKEQKGHLAGLSCLAGIVAPAVYYMSGRKYEKFLGTIRDISAIIFDSSLCLNESSEVRKAGWLFLVEAAIDAVARFLPQKYRYPINQLAHGMGRYGLEIYKDKHAQDIVKAEKEAAAQVY